MEKLDKKDKILKVVSVTVFVTAITQLALSQLSIRIMRLSAEELTGIAYFAFIISGLVTLFVTSRMKEVFFGRVFACIMNLVTMCAGLWSLQMLFFDEMFFRNLYYSLNRQTQTFELLSLSSRISSSIPLALISLGIIIYFLCAFVILIITLTSIRKNKIENSA
jgi:hypothetical protein